MKEGVKYLLSVWIREKPIVPVKIKPVDFIVQISLKSQTQVDVLKSSYPNARLIFAAEGAGTELGIILNKLKFEPKPGCKCDQHIQQMNINGTKWCSENEGTIISWLEEEARRANLPFTKLGAALLVKHAIRKAKKQKLRLSENKVE